MFALISICSLKAQNLKIGVLNKQAVWQGLLVKDGVLQQLEQQQLRIGREFQELKREFEDNARKLDSEYQATQDEDRKKQIQQTIMELKSNLEEKARGFETQMAQFEEKVVNDLNTKVDNAVEQVVKERNIKHLVHTSTKQGVSIVYFMDDGTNKAYNITSQVAEILNVQLNN
ncbi:OmpH family outer membrane protein [Roseivirga pacifica]|uniref:OmpH family outer membrane protein n=1 Tax=Roseivirga pacifica TaxID=1267423 RepID=UPI00227B3CBA|nr:OmpH family outer membrane protein [Roseivirga pacifica]